MKSDLLRIGDVAARAGVSVDTVRYYERKGLLHDVRRDASGYRRFPSEAVERIRLIRTAAAIGFTLDELAAIFRRRASGKPPCDSVLDVARKKLTALEQQIRTLQTLRETLHRVITSWEDRIEDAPPGGLAHLLESLIDGEHV